MNDLHTTVTRLPIVCTILCGPSLIILTTLTWISLELMKSVRIDQYFAKLPFIVIGSGAVVVVVIVFYIARRRGWIRI